MATRVLRRVIAHLVTPISLAAITDMTARDFVRAIPAITWWLFAYHYIANPDAQFSARYIACGDATFAHDICALGQVLLWRVIRVIMQVVLTHHYSAFAGGFPSAIISIILIFTCNHVKFIYASLNELKIIKVN